MINISYVSCPNCGYINKVNIPENNWLLSLKCDFCGEMIIGGPNPHGWTWVLCAHGDVPWLQRQKIENLK